MAIKTEAAARTAEQYLEILEQEMANPCISLKDMQEKFHKAAEIRVELMAYAMEECTTVQSTHTVH